MLVKSVLESKLKESLEEIIAPSFEQAIKNVMPVMGDSADTLAKQFGETLTDTLVPSLAQAIASAIDYYVKSISISGTIVTTGTPVSQQAVVFSPSPVTNGIVPNSLKIQ